MGLAGLVWAAAHRLLVLHRNSASLTRCLHFLLTASTDKTPSLLEEVGACTRLMQDLLPALTVSTCWGLDQAGSSLAPCRAPSKGSCRHQAYLLG